MKYVMKAEMVQGWSFERCHMGKEDKDKVIMNFEVSVK